MVRSDLVKCFWLVKDSSCLGMDNRDSTFRTGLYLETKYPHRRSRTSPRVARVIDNMACLSLNWPWQRCPRECKILRSLLTWRCRFYKGKYFDFSNRGARSFYRGRVSHLSKFAWTSQESNPHPCNVTSQSHYFSFSTCWYGLQACHHRNNPWQYSRYPCGFYRPLWSGQYLDDSRPREF